MPNKCAACPTHKEGKQALQCQWTALAKLQELSLEHVVDTIGKLWQLTAPNKVSIVASIQSSMSVTIHPHSRRVMMDSIRPDVAFVYVELQPRIHVVAVHICDGSSDLDMCAVKCNFTINRIPDLTYHYRYCN